MDDESLSTKAIFRSSQDDYQGQASIKRAISNIATKKDGLQCVSHKLVYDGGGIPRFIATRLRGAATGGLMSAIEEPYKLVDLQHPSH